METTLFRKNSTIWEHIYKSGGPGSSLLYPCEDLVVAVNRYLPKSDEQNKKVLVIGFGSGNNLTFLASKNFDCYGVEVAQSAIKIAQERLSKNGLKATLEKIEGNRYPFADDYFDVVIAWHVLSYNDEKSLPGTLTEIKRVLKDDGILLATLSTFKDFLATHGKRISRNINQFGFGESNQNGAVIIAAEDEKEIKSLFGLFSDLEIGYSEISIKGLTNSHWLVYGRKNSV